MYGPRKEHFIGPLRCPLIGCPISFESLGLCLQHLTTCAWLSNSWYWCPLCQRPERFAEPGPTLSQPPKLVTVSGTSKFATLLPQKSTVVKISTARFWKHFRNKSNLLSAHPILPMIRSRKDVDSVTSHRQSPPGYETGFPWDPLASYHVPSANVETDESTGPSPPMDLKSTPYRLDKYDVSMQHPELEAAPFNLSHDAELNQRHELESQSYSLNNWTAPTQSVELGSHPYETNNLTSSERRPELESSPKSQRSELQGDQLWTEGWNETPELYNNEPNHQRLLELPGSLPSYTETQHLWSPNKHLSAKTGFQPVSPWASTLPPGVLASSSIANSAPHYSSAAQHYERPFQPLDSGPTGITLARHERFSSTLDFNNTPVWQLTSFDQSSCQASPLFGRSSQTGHGQARAMAQMESIGGQSSRKTVGWHNLPQPDPLAEYSDAVTRNSRRCRDEALLRTLDTHNPIMSMPYPSKEPLPALGNEDHVMANHAPEGPNRTVNPAGLKSQGPLDEHSHQQQIWPISPLAASDTTLSACSSIISPVSSNAARGAHSNYGQTLPMRLNELPTTPDSSSLSDRSSTKTSVSSSTTGKTSIEGSPVTSWKQCSKCPIEFTGSFQDRKTNMKRHLQYACSAHAGPRERFECSTNGCNKSYSRPDNLAKHCQKEHQGVPALQRSNAQKVRRNF